MGRTRKELSVIKVREILRLKEQGLSNRQTASSCRISSSTVWEYATAAKERGIRLQDYVDRSDAELLAALGKPRSDEERRKTEPDYRRLHTELRRKGVTLLLLWTEYRQEHPEDGYGYSRFCELYEAWCEHQEIRMPQQHKAGERLFVDYAGDSIPIIDRSTGLVLFDAQIFVATLGASNYTYVEASRDQGLSSWLMSHVRAFEFFGGAPEILVPDNLKSGVKDAWFYEPEINRSYQELAEHYGCAVLPARVRKPRDKAKVENAVQNTARRILAPLRDRDFGSLDELNQAIKELLNLWLHRQMKGYGKSRQELFVTLDKPALKPLPQNPYVFSSWKKVRVNIDYHVAFERCFYSVPHTFLHQEAFVKATEKTVEILVGGNSVALHPRLFVPGQYSTISEHMPPKHRFRAEWTPERLINWGAKVGPHTQTTIKRVLASKRHPEQGFRASLGIMRFASSFSPQELEVACAHVNSVGIPSCRRVHAALVAKRLNHNQSSNDELTLRHSNVRGGDFYH